MKIVLSMVVRDELDIIDAQLAYHLNAGVDLILVTDHRSVDGTSEILERYERGGRLRVIREEEELTNQGGWMTRMARLAATEHGADWVLNSDADEFWWPHGAPLGDVLGSVPRSFDVVQAVSRYFVPRPDDGRAFAERMTVRLAPEAAINDPATPFRPVAKVAHRAHPDVVVQDGNHAVQGARLKLLRAWRPIEILHFPLRTPTQCARKYEKTWLAWEHNLRGDLARARALSEEARLDYFYRRVVVDAAAEERGLAAGSLVVDTRLRDTLRRIDAGRPIEFGTPSHSEDFGLGRDISTLDEADGVRLQRRIDELAVRVASVESQTAS
jgi:hypothetical protein